MQLALPSQTTRHSRDQGRSCSDAAADAPNAIPCHIACLPNACRGGLHGAAATARKAGGDAQMRGSGCVHRLSGIHRCRQMQCMPLLLLTHRTQHAATSRSCPMRAAAACTELQLQREKSMAMRGCAEAAAHTSCLAFIGVVRLCAAAAFRQNLLRSGLKPLALFLCTVAADIDVQVSRLNSFTGARRLAAGSNAWRTHLRLLRRRLLAVRDASAALLWRLAICHFGTRAR